MKAACAACAALLLAAGANGLNNGAAETPPMGWSTWNAFHCNFNETTLLEVGQAMSTSGMVAAGYKTLNIDDCWPMKHRAANGSLIPDPTKFPNGMGYLSAKLSELGLGLGIYTAHGPLTCQDYPGSLGYEKQDVALYNTWNVTYVKNDWCWRLPNVTQEMHLNAFNAMRDALAALERPVVHSIHWNSDAVPGPNCALGVDCPMPDTANMWRIGGDIGPVFTKGVLRLLDADAKHAAAAGPGSWNDADMLEVGNGMAEEQDKAHFSLWCMLASPLIAGNDLRTMTAATIAILTNKHAIEINQDPLGHQGIPVSTAADNSTQVWAKPLVNGGYGVVFLNRLPVRGSPNITIQLAFDLLPTMVGTAGQQPAARNGNAAQATVLAGPKKFEALAVWNDGKSIGTFSNTLSATVAGSSVAFYKLEPVQ